MARWVGGVLVLALAGLFLARFVVHPVRDAWTLVAANGDGSITWLRLSTSNTGLFADELTTRLVIVPPTGRGVEQRAVRGNGVLDAEGATAGPDQLRHTGDTWRFVLGGDAVQARGHVRGASVDCPPTAGEVAGIVEFQPDGITLDGGGLVVRSHAEGTRDGTVLYVPDRSVQVVVDPDAPCPAWWRDGPESWAGEPGPWSFDGDRASIELGPRRWTMRITRMGTVLPAMEGALPVEQALARLAGFSPPPEALNRVLVDPGDGRRLPGLLLRRDRAL